MRLSIPNKTHPKAKQHGYWFGQEKNRIFREILEYDMNTPDKSTLT